MVFLSILLCLFISGCGAEEKKNVVECNHENEEIVDGWMYANCGKSIYGTPEAHITEDKMLVIDEIHESMDMISVIFSMNNESLESYSFTKEDGKFNTYDLNKWCNIARINHNLSIKTGDKITVSVKGLISDDESLYPTDCVEIGSFVFEEVECLHEEWDEFGICINCYKPICGRPWGAGELDHSKTFVDADNDSYCDICHYDFCFGYHTNTDNDLRCDVCDTPFCLLNGVMLSDGEPASFYHTDNNGDGRCDGCNDYICRYLQQDENGNYINIHRDNNGDFKCDICGEYMCSFGISIYNEYLHIDNNNDYHCDRCDAHWDWWNDNGSGNVNDHKGGMGGV